MEVTIMQVLLLIIGALLCVLQTVAIMIFNMQGKKIEQFCGQNEKEHNDIWKHLNHHKHTDCGEVVITRGVDA